MFRRFVLKKLLKKALKLPVVVGIVYPTIGGDVVLKNVVLQPQDIEEKAKSQKAKEQLLPFVKIDKLRIDLQWSSLRDPVLLVESAGIDGWHAQASSTLRSPGQVRVSDRTRCRTATNESRH